MANNEYATTLDQLDIEIPGAINNEVTLGRIQTKDFVYVPGSAGVPGTIAIAQRIPQNGTYFLSVYSSNPARIHCDLGTSPTSVQRKLCSQFEASGSL